MKTVVLGLGSNNTLGSMTSVEILAHAVGELSAVVKDIQKSSVYESDPMYVTDQNNFYNMVVRGGVSDDCSPYELLDFIHRIEAKYGRDRSKEIRFGPRTLDIDIEEFGSVVINDPDLILPHPRIHERQFVLLPLLEILKLSADRLVVEKYEKMLKLLPNQGVRLCGKEIQDEFNTFLARI